MSHEGTSASLGALEVFRGPDFKIVLLALLRRSLYKGVGVGDEDMRKVWAMVVLISLGSAVGACSKCDVPDMLPKFCRAGPAPSQN